MEQYVQEKSFNNNAGFKNHNNATASSFPNNCVGAIYHQTSLGRKMIGTGFLVGSDLVLTVAHIVCERGKGMFEQYSRRNLIFYPGVSDDLVRGYKVVTCRYREKFLSDPLVYDYALLKLEDKIVQKEYLQLGLNYPLEQQELRVIGYRSDSCDEDYATQSSVEWPNQHMVKGHLLLHKLSTRQGVSGSPLLVKRNNKDIAIAIHFGGMRIDPYNGGRIITDDVLCDLICWEKQMASSIKFHVMNSNSIQEHKIESDLWLPEMQKKISAFLSDLPKQTAILNKQLQDLKLDSPKKHSQAYYSKESIMDIPQFSEFSQIITNQQTTSLKFHLQQLVFESKKCLKTCCPKLFTPQCNLVSISKVKNQFNIYQLVNFFISVSDLLIELSQNDIFIIGFSLSNISFNEIDQYKLIQTNGTICYSKLKQHRCLGLIKQIFFTLQNAIVKKINIQIDVNSHRFLSYAYYFIQEIIRQIDIKQDANIRRQIYLNKFQIRLKRLYIDFYVHMVQEIIKDKRKNKSSELQKKKYQQILHMVKLLNLGKVSFEKIKNIKMATNDESSQINSNISQGCSEEGSSLSTQPLAVIAQNVIKLNYNLKNVKFDYKGYLNVKNALFHNHFSLLRFLTTHRQSLNIALYELKQGWSNHFINKELFEYQMEQRSNQIYKPTACIFNIDLNFLVKEKLKQLSSPDQQDQKILAYLLTKGKTEIISFTLDVANGIQQLEALGIYHSDLIFRNIIKTNKYKIIDFDRAYKFTWESPSKTSTECFNNTQQLFKIWAQSFYCKNSLQNYIQSKKLLKYIFREYPYIDELAESLFNTANQKQLLKLFTEKMEQYARYYHLSQFKRLVQCLMCSQLIGQEHYFNKQQFDHLNSILNKFVQNGGIYQYFRSSLLIL